MAGLGVQPARGGGLVRDEGRPDGAVAEVAFADGGVEAEAAGVGVAVHGEGVVETVVKDAAEIVRWTSILWCNKEKPVLYMEQVHTL